MGVNCQLDRHDNDWVVPQMAPKCVTTHPNPTRLYYGRIHPPIIANDWQPSIRKHILPSHYHYLRWCVRPLGKRLSQQHLLHDILSAGAGDRSASIIRVHCPIARENAIVLDFSFQRVPGQGYVNLCGPRMSPKAIHVLKWS